MKLDCALETRTKKDGSTYEVIVIKLTQNVEKLVFLDNAEKELIKLSKLNK